MIKLMNVTRIEVIRDEILWKTYNATRQMFLKLDISRCKELCANGFLPLVDLYFCFASVVFVVHCGGMPPVAAHRCCKVDTMGGRTGLLLKILSISSMMLLVSLGRSCRLCRSLQSCSTELADTITT